MKGKLFKRGIDYVVNQAVLKIEASKDVWASATAEGFRENWRDWMALLEPQLRSVVMRLPQKSGDIRANVVNRCLPVAQVISQASKRYKAMKLGGVVVAPAPAVAVAPVAR